MILVGQYQLNPAPDDHSLLISAFHRLPKEVRFRGRHARMVGFETLEIPGACLRFLGVEVDAIDVVPEGLMAWELGSRQWTAWNARGEIQWNEAITWNWLEASHHTPGRFSGEFTGCGNPDWWGGSAPRPQRFSLFANVYVDPEKVGFKDDVQLADPDPAWPDAYERMAVWLKEHLGPRVALRVEHYGSTAIPGLPAKPVIDVLVEVPSFEEGRQRLVPALDEDTWEYWWYGGHMVFFKRKAVMEERTHHIHCAPAGHDLWKGLAFRDYLRKHPGDVARYAELKRRLAETHRHDREAYTQAKAGFVQEINRKALA